MMTRNVKRLKNDLLEFMLEKAAYSTVAWGTCFDYRIVEKWCERFRQEGLPVRAYYEKGNASFPTHSYRLGIEGRYPPSVVKRVFKIIEEERSK